MRGGQRNSGTLPPRLSGDASGQTRSFRTHDGGIVNLTQEPEGADPWENFGAPTMKEEDEEEEEEEAALAAAKKDTSVQDL